MTTPSPQAVQALQSIRLSFSSTDGVTLPSKEWYETEGCTPLPRGFTFSIRLPCLKDPSRSVSLFIVTLTKPECTVADIVAPIRLLFSKPIKSLSWHASIGLGTRAAAVDLDAAHRVRPSIEHELFRLYDGVVRVDGVTLVHTRFSTNTVVDR